MQIRGSKHLKTSDKMYSYVLKLQGLILWVIRMLKWIRKSQYTTAVELFCDKFYSAVDV